MAAAVSVIKFDLGLDGNSCFGWLKRKRQEARQGADVKYLNMLMPSVDSYISLQEGGVPEEMVRYFEQMTVVMPEMSEGYFVLGFCYYRQGLKEKAFIQFQRAFLLDQGFFWSSYNLAVIALQVRQYALAERMLSAALETDPLYTVKKMLSSKVFRDILSSGEAHDLVADIQGGYIKAAKVRDLLRSGAMVSLEALGLKVELF